MWSCEAAPRRGQMGHGAAGGAGTAALMCLCWQVTAVSNLLLVLLSTALARGCDSQMSPCCSSSIWAPAREREEWHGEGWREAGAALKLLLRANGRGTELEGKGWGKERQILSIPAAKMLELHCAQ